MPALTQCIVLVGPELVPHQCPRFAWNTDTVTEIEIGKPCDQLTGETRIIVPGLYNAHTHLGDAALPEGAAGLTLEEGFFRPHGYKYRELAKIDPTTHENIVAETLRYMASTGTVAHIDFREQGAGGAKLLRSASERTGVKSIILSQFDSSPFSPAQLESNTDSLPESAQRELSQILEVADGISESTMNDLTDSAWREIKEATQAKARLRAIHCLENSGYRETSMARTGKGDLVRAIELWDPHLIVHLTAAIDEEIAALVKAQKTGVLNPRANTTLGLPIPPIIKLIDAGANLLLGTDNVMLNPPNLFAELDFTWRLARSQSGESRASSPAPNEVLKMATSNVRAALGGDHYGWLAPKLPASFVVIDATSPHLRHSRNLLTTITTRVGSADILATFGFGEKLWSRPDFATD
ncbi:MAG: amidohydrolase family protein [Synoicihabitans sp.]